MSEPAAAACRQLRGLQPAEAVGAVCWLLDEVSSAVEPAQLRGAAAMCDEVAAFATGVAKRCLERAQQRPSPR